jgi:hypothetical protein
VDEKIIEQEELDGIASDMLGKDVWDATQEVVKSGVREQLLKVMLAAYNRGWRKND